MKELWTAQVHLLTPPAEFGDTKCCTNVVAWAEDAEDFTATVSDIFARRHWSIVSVHQCRRADDCTAMVEELTEQIEQAKSQPGSCIFGTLHYYPSRPA
jgi:2-oxo-4-hydroxy-4-carboxy--5-ureidoimidazoline (OHCU) decarboxylase